MGAHSRPRFDIPREYYRRNSSCWWFLLRLLLLLMLLLLETACLPSPIDTPVADCWVTAQLIVGIGYMSAHVLAWPYFSQEIKWASTPAPVGARHAMAQKISPSFSSSRHTA